MTKEPTVTQSSSSLSSPVVKSALLAPRLTIGIDLGDRWSHYCILESNGMLVRESRLPTTQAAFAKFFADYEDSRAVFEAGTHSKWVALVLGSIGCETIVANPRRLPLISASYRKNDTNDARMLARLGRADPELLAPIKHRGMENHAANAVLRARDVIVATRTKLINSVRGLVKPFGERIAGCPTISFHKHAPAQIPEELREATGPLIDTIADLTERIRAYNKLIEEMCEERFIETKILRQVTGVGALTGLAFALVIDDPARFKRSRNVGPFLGLVPRQRDSGNKEPELRITKAGDSYVRRLLVQSAHYILGPFGPDCDLRRFGQRLEARGKKSAKKRAIVAVARKLAVLLHRLWVTQAEYEPLRNANRLATETAQQSS